MTISEEIRILISGTLNKRTRDKLKEAYKKLDSRKAEIHQKVKEIYKEQGDGNTYYCMESMIEELANKRGYLQAIQLLIEYYRICGQQDVLSNIVMHQTILEYSRDNVLTIKERIFRSITELNELYIHFAENENKRIASRLDTIVGKLSELYDILYNNEK